MTAITSKIAAVCVIAFAATTAVADEPEVLCELGRNQVYEGESVPYRVTLNHVTDPSPPELLGFDDFDVALVGTQNLNSSQITIINGHRTDVIRRGRAYNYLLTPKRTGLLTVPAPIARVDGKILQGHALSLKVVEPNSQGAVRMQITASPESVYPTQRMTVTLSVLVRALPDELADRNPLSIQSSPPALSIPWVDDERIPDGLKPVENAGAWLSPLRDPRGEGFSINGLVDRSPLSLFDRRALTFQPRARRVFRKDAAGENVEYWLYEFKRSFIPQRAGTFSFGPATIKGTFAAGMGATGRLTGEQVYAVAPRFDALVKQVPDEGRPADYLGVIGRCTWSADLKPAQCKVGDPVTLTLTLRGKGSLTTAAAPNLAEVSGVAENFKTYEGTREIKGDTCRFTYTLRPLNDQITQFPSIPGAYFDVTTDRYVTLETNPIPMIVSKAAALAQRRIVGGGSSRTPDELQVRREGIFANVTDPDELRDEAVHAAYWLVGLGVLAGLYAATATATWYIRRRTADPKLVRRRAAVARARRRLREGTNLLKTSSTQRGAEDVRGALVGLIADVADVSEAGMTSAEACRRLHELGADQELVDRLSQSLEACDATRYTPTGAGVNGLAGEADHLLNSVVQSLKKQRCLR